MCLATWRRDEGESWSRGAAQESPGSSKVRLLWVYGFCQAEFRSTPDARNPSSSGNATCGCSREAVEHETCSRRAQKRARAVRSSRHTRREVLLSSMKQTQSQHQEYQVRMNACRQTINFAWWAHGYQARSHGERPLPKHGPACPSTGARLAGSEARVHV